MELHAAREMYARRREDRKTTQHVRRSLTGVFQKAQKIIDLDEGLNLQHFVKIGQGVLKPRRTIGEALLAKVKQTAQNQGKSGVISTINKAYAKKVRAE